VSEQQHIVEAEFFRALGLDPATIKAGSLGVKMQGNIVEIEFTQTFVVPPHLIGTAFLAAGPPPEPGPEMLKEPQDHKPPAKKAPAKKTTPRKKS
jgi:hypothetical protein